MSKRFHEFCVYFHRYTGVALRNINLRPSFLRNLIRRGKYHSLHDIAAGLQAGLDDLLCNRKRYPLQIVYVFFQKFLLFTGNTLNNIRNSALKFLYFLIKNPSLLFVCFTGAVPSSFLMAFPVPLLSQNLRLPAGVRSEERRVGKECRL